MKGIPDNQASVESQYKAFRIAVMQLLVMHHPLFTGRQAYVAINKIYKIPKRLGIPRKNIGNFIERLLEQDLIEEYQESEKRSFELTLSGFNLLRSMRKKWPEIWQVNKYKKIRKPRGKRNFDKKLIQNLADLRAQFIDSKSFSMSEFLTGMKVLDQIFAELKKDEPDVSRIKSGWIEFKNITAKVFTGKPEKYLIKDVSRIIKSKEQENKNKFKSSYKLDLTCHFCGKKVDEDEIVTDRFGYGYHKRCFSKAKPTKSSSGKARIGEYTFSTKSKHRSFQKAQAEGRKKKNKD